MAETVTAKLIEAANVRLERHVIVRSAVIPFDWPEDLKRAIAGIADVRIEWSIAPDSEPQT